MGPAWSSAELDEITCEDPATVFAVLADSRLVAVVSVEHPTEEQSSYGLTGLAVNPHHQRRGGDALDIANLLQYTFRARVGSVCQHAEYRWTTISGAARLV